MRNLLIVGAALAVLVGVNSAQAADLGRPAPVYKAPPPVLPVFSWTGFYIGGVGTYGWSHSKHCDDNTCTDGTPNPAEVHPSFDMKGWLGGATVGYNWQSQNWVLGVEGDWSGGKIDGSSGSTPGFGCVGLCLTEITSIGTARGRVGYAFDRFLPYVTAGAAFTRLHSSLGAPLLEGGTTTKTDFVVGGGFEYAFASLPKLSAKIEYLYITKLGDFLYGPNICVAPGCFSRTDGVNLLRVGVNYHF